MGLTVLELEVASVANPERTEKLEFLIDSGAVYSVVPATVLERLGIKPLSQQEFRLANGEKIMRRKGGAVFRYKDGRRCRRDLRRGGRRHAAGRLHPRGARPVPGPPEAGVARCRVAVDVR